MAEQIITKRDEVKGLLRKLFRSDQADLDFGIYRIMNFKRKEIEKFIDHDLIEYAEAEFKEYSRASTVELERELEEDRRRIEGLLGSGIFNAAGDPVKYLDVKAVQEYEVKRKTLREAALTEEQVNDVFSHVYEFFSRYYEDGDFIPKTRYGGRDKYYIPYNGEEVALHWATKDMYYVKTGEYFKKYSFKAGRFTVTFYLVEAKVETGNVKGEKKYFVLVDEEPVHLDEATSSFEIKFNYRGLSEQEKSKHGTRNIQSALVTEALERIRSSIESSSIVGILRPRAGEDRSLMERHLNAYVDRNSKDFFIHKDLKGFLERELDFYLKNEVWNLDELDTLSQGSAKTISAKIKAIRNIALNIVEFLNQIESFQKKLFEKKKFVLRTNYCITLDLIPEEYYENIGLNERQVKEWKLLYNLDELTKGTFYNTKGKNTFSSDFIKKYKYMAIDTSLYNREFIDEIFNKIEYNDDKVNGILIKGDNLHVLNLLNKKYVGKIKCIYIDPPYNTGIDGFNYKDNYQQASWLSMMEDRVSYGINLLSNNGLINISIDDNEVANLKIILNNILGQDNFLEQVIWKKRNGPPNDKIIGGIHEYILIYAKNMNDLLIYPKKRDDKQLNRYKNLDNHPKGPWTAGDLMANVKGGRYVESLYFPITNPNTGEKHYPSSHGNWRFNKEKIEELLKNNEIYFGENGKSRPKLKRFLREIKEGIAYSSIWDYLAYNSNATSEIENYFGSVNLFDTPKPINLIKEISNLSMSNKDIIMDYFAGSGSTADAIINLNRLDNGDRKFILIEMEDYFDELLKPRLIKTIFSEEWKKGKPISLNGTSGFFKYQYLEQYEDTLNNIQFLNPDKTLQILIDRFPDYFLFYIIDYETRESPTRLSIEKFKTPFNYRIKTLSAGEEREEPVDLVETFNYLLGLQVKKIRTHRDGDRLYRTVFGEHDHEQVAVIWRDTPGLDLERDKHFIEDKILAGSTPDTIFVNGDSYIRNAKPIEPEFRRLMGA
jgi:adenine-specific DNA-methyltransferase